MKEKVLFVDDDKNILASFKRQFFKKYRVLVADSPLKALEIIRDNGPFAVIISDMRMPQMDGVEFLTKTKELHPDSVRVILTGHADMESAIGAVNKGNISRFLTKPCPKDDLSLALEACIRQYRLIKAEKELLQGTLRGSINVLTEILSLTNPEAFGRASRIKRIVKWLAKHLKVPDVWRYELAAMLSQIGCVALPSSTMEKIYAGQKLNPEERQVFEMHPQLAKNLLQNIPRMDKVAAMISYQEKHFSGAGIPVDQVKGKQIPLGARILKVALDYDLLESRGLSKAKIYKTMKEQTGVYDPRVLSGLEVFLGEEAKYEVRVLPLAKIKPGMLFGQEVRASNGLLLVARGQETSRTLMLRLKNFANNIGIEEPVKMLVPVK